MQKTSHQPTLFDLRRPRVGTYEDQMAYIARLPECHRPIHITMRELALRVGEACALKISDLDIPNRRILLGRISSTGRPSPKMWKAMWLPLSDMAFEAANAASAGRSEEQFLFVNPITGKGYKPSFLRKLYKKYGFPHLFKLYELFRTTTITDWVRNSQVSVFAIKELARFSNSRAIGRYFWITMEDLRRLVNRRIQQKP